MDKRRSCSSGPLLLASRHSAGRSCPTPTATRPGAFRSLAPVGPVRRQGGIRRGHSPATTRIVSLERSTRQDLIQGMGWRMPVSSESSIRLQCRRPFGGECSHAAGCLTGPGAFPRRRGNDTRTHWLPLSSGQGHVRAARGLPTPCRREDGLHVSRPVSTVPAGGRVNAQEKQGRVVPAPNDRPPCPIGDTPSVDGPGSRPGRVARDLPFPTSGSLMNARHNEPNNGSKTSNPARIMAATDPTGLTTSRMM
jgi:hypothetical protein